MKRALLFLLVVTAALGQGPRPPVDEFKKLRDVNWPAISDGQFLKRSGTTIIGASGGGGGLFTDLDFTNSQSISLSLLSPFTLYQTGTGTIPLITAGGSDTDIPLAIRPKGNAFVQLGPDTRGLSYYSSLPPIVEIYSSSATGSGIISELFARDVAANGVGAASFVAQTQSVATNNVSFLTGSTSQSISSLPTGRTLTDAFGQAIYAYNSGAGTITNAYGLYVDIGNDGGGSIGTAYNFWASDLTGKATNGYYMWFDAPGVYRVKSDGVMAYYNPTFSPKYTPGATNYERVVQQWNSNVLEYGTEAGGTGTLRGVKIIGASLETPDLTAANITATTAFHGLPHVVHLSQSSGTTLTTGTKPFQKAKYAGSIVGWTLTCTPSCSITVDLLRSADGAGIPTASMIGTGTKPAIASGLENKLTSAPTGWTSTAITAYDNLAISLSGITDATQVSLDVYYQ